MVAQVAHGITYPSNAAYARAPRPVMRGDVEAGYVDGKLRASLPANVSLDGQNGGSREITIDVRDASRQAPVACRSRCN